MYFRICYCSFSFTVVAVFPWAQPAQLAAGVQSSTLLAKYLQKNRTCGVNMSGSTQIWWNYIRFESMPLLEPPRRDGTPPPLTFTPAYLSRDANSYHMYVFDWVTFHHCIKSPNCVFLTVQSFLCTVVTCGLSLIIQNHRISKSSLRVPDTFREYSFFFFF